MTRKLDLGGEWKLISRTAGIETTGFVPGSILNDLMEGGLAKDPFYRDNEYETYEIFRNDFEYVRTFKVDGDMTDADLVCEGLDTICDIFINNEKIASTDNMHRAYRFPVGEYLNEGGNEIRIVIKSPVGYIEEKKDDSVWGVNAKDGYQFIRKAHYMFGWDWGPAIPDGGIWRPIRLESTGGGGIGDVHVRQTHQDEKVKLNIRAEILEGFDCETKAFVEITDPRGVKIGEYPYAEDKLEIDIENPELWWPRGYGLQPLYTVRVVLLSNGVHVDEKSVRTGLRTFRIAREDDKWGQKFAYEINGVEIFAMGANYIPEDNVLARCSAEKTEKLIKAAVEANFNTLRVWGGGIYPDKYFYDLCDEYGILVWQDFMFACAQYEIGDREFVESVKSEIRDNVRRLRNHPSVAIWCGNNEMEWIWTNEQTEGATKKQKDDYLELFEQIIPPIVANEDPDRLYWPSSPSSGGGFDDANDENRGDVHYWEVWHGLKPFTEYRKYHFRFCSEFGFQSFPCMKTIESYTAPEDRNIFSRIMESHQKNGGANGKILYYLAENFKYPCDLDALAYVSQLLQAEAIRYGVEHWRRNRGRCMGSIYWQFNDCWPVASWSGIDYHHRWKALHYYAKRFYNPVMLSIHDKGEELSLNIANETMEKVEGELSWKLVSTDGAVISSGSENVSIESLSARAVRNLDFTGELKTGDDRRKAVFSCSFKHGGGVTENRLLFVPPKHFEFTEPTYGITCKDRGDHLSITLESDVFAGFVELDYEDCVFSDNYFHLLPGEAKNIRLDKKRNNIEATPEDICGGLKVRSIYDTY